LVGRRAAAPITESWTTTLLAMDGASYYEGTVTDSLLI